MVQSGQTVRRMEEVMAPPAKRREDGTLRKRLLPPRPPQSLYSEANLVTAVRLVVSLAFFALAVVAGRELYNFVGLAVHWAGDSLDGWTARHFRQETVLGAEADIVADRVETLFFFVNFVHFHPALFLPVVVYILDFAVVDFYLSYQFVKFDIISINYFDRVDRRVYDLNFSPAGKLANSAVVPLILIFAPAARGVALALAGGLIAVKVHSAGRLLRLRTGRPASAAENPSPEEVWP